MNNISKMLLNIIFRKYVSVSRGLKTNSYLVTGEKNIIDIKNFNFLKKLLIITSWVSRFICSVKSRICGKKSNLKNYLNGGEINDSKNLWLQISQEELIDSDKFENLKKLLRLKEDEIGLYLCTARISQNSSIIYETRNPIILNRNHVLTKLLRIAITVLNTIENGIH